MQGGMQNLDGLGGRLLGSGAAPSVPSDITGLLAWYKADAISGTNNVAIASWPDSSGNGRTVTPNGTGFIYRSSILNSLPVVEVQGDYGPFASAANLGTSHTVFIVVRPLAGWSDGVVLGGDALGKYTPYLDATDIYYRAVGSEAFVNVAHGGLSNNTGYLLEIVRSGTSVSFYKNGTQIGTTQTLAANTALTIQQLSGLAGSTLAINLLQLAEVFFYDTALSTANRQAMETYCNNRFALF